jgi:hypothetical protein
MSAETLWIVIESVSLIQLPNMTFDYNTNFSEFGYNSQQPVWYEPDNSHRSILPEPRSLTRPDNSHRSILPEPQKFLKPNNIHQREPLVNIKLVGVYSNFESAQLAVGVAPNRKILGPTVVIN